MTETQLDSHDVDDGRELRELLQVRPPSDIVAYLNMMVYGDPGTGKTFLAGTADDSELTSPLLMIDVEGGMTTLKDRQNVDVKPVRSVKDVQDLYNTIYPTIKDGKIYYKTIAIDSLTELADLDMKEIMAREYAAKPDKLEPDVATQSAWGKSRKHMRDIIRAFRDLPCNVIYIASVATLQEEGQPNKVFPGFAGKLKTEVPGFMDIVGYYYAEVNPVNGEVTRKLQVQGTRRVVAKDRTSAFGGLVENPTIPMMWEILQQQNTHTDTDTNSEPAASQSAEAA